MRESVLLAVFILIIAVLLFPSKSDFSSAQSSVPMDAALCGQQIFQSNGTIYLYSCSSGLMLYSSSSFTATLTDAVGLRPSNPGCIVIQAGNYTLDAPFTLTKSRVCIKGAGMQMTLLNAKSGLIGQLLFSITGSASNPPVTNIGYDILSDLTIDGGANAGSPVFYSAYTTELTIQRVHFTNGAGSPVFWSSTDNLYLTVRDSRVDTAHGTNNLAAVTVENNADWVLFDNVFTVADPSQTNTLGFDLEKAALVTITNSHIEAGSYAVQAYSSNRNKVIGNTLLGGTVFGADIGAFSGSYDNIFLGNMMRPDTLVMQPAVLEDSSCIRDSYTGNDASGYLGLSIFSSSSTKTGNIGL